MAEEIPERRRRSPCGSYGDINGDGWITDNDIELVRQIVAGTITPTEKQKKLADVYNDGEVDIYDVMMLQHYLAGNVDTFPVCETYKEPIFQINTTLLVIIVIVILLVIYLG